MYESSAELQNDTNSFCWYVAAGGWSLCSRNAQVQKTAVGAKCGIGHMLHRHRRYHGIVPVLPLILWRQMARSQKKKMKLPSYVSLTSIWPVSTPTHLPISSNELESGRSPIPRSYTW